MKTLVNIENPAVKSAFACILLFSVVSGCDVGARSKKNLATAPDETVEYLVEQEGVVTEAEESFLKLVNREDQKLVLVDFWAPWCGPCKMLSPSLVKIKQDWGDQVEIVKVNTDKSKKLVQYFEVNGIPDVRIFRNGQQVADFGGPMPRAEINALLKSLQ